MVIDDLASLKVLVIKVDGHKLVLRHERQEFLFDNFTVFS
jgi:hypothetical protein